MRDAVGTFGGRGAQTVDLTSKSGEEKHIRILFLDKKNALIADEVQQTGTVDHTPVYPREVMRRALELSASAIILVHNHPTIPSKVTLDHAQYR